MTTKIKFGTSGWRAIIADDFTFANVRLATEAIGALRQRVTTSVARPSSSDTTRDSPPSDFGREAARVLSSQGIRALLCDKPVPLPASPGRSYSDNSTARSTSPPATIPANTTA